MEDRWFYLLDAYLENCLTDSEAGELRELLRASSDARRAFWQYVEQHALIEDVLAESRGRDLASIDESDLCEVALVDPPPPSRNRRRSHFWTMAIGALAATFLVVLGLWMYHKGEPASDGPTSTPEPVATLHAPAGNVQVADASGEPVAVADGSRLFRGQILRVGEEVSRVEVRFLDGTLLTLGSGTSIRLLSHENPERKKFHLERGSVQVQTASQSEGQPLVVTTDQARITASETRFRLYQEGKSSRLELAEGKARLEKQRGGQAVDLTEGSFVLVTDESQPMITQSLPDARCSLRHTLLKAGDAVCFSRDGSQIVTSHFDRGWKSWDSRDGTLRAAAPGAGQWTDGLAYTADENTMLALGRRGTASLWKIGEPRAEHTRLRDQELRCGAVSEDGRWLAQGGSNGEVALWEADTEKGSISLRRSFPIKPSRVALSCVGPRLAVSRWGGEIHLLDGKNGREVGQYKLSRNPTPLALSADGRFLAAYAHHDGLVLFDEGTKARQVLWAGQGARVGCLRFSWDGRVLLAGLSDGTVRAWSTEDGRLLLVLETGHRYVSQVVVMTELNMLATVGDNDCVKIWECQFP